MILGKFKWYWKYETFARHDLTSKDYKILNQYKSEEEVMNCIPEELIYLPYPITIKIFCNWVHFKRMFGKWPSYREAIKNRKIFTEGMFK